MHYQLVNSFNCVPGGAEYQASSKIYLKISRRPILKKLKSWSQDGAYIAPNETAIS